MGRCYDPWSLSLFFFFVKVKDELHELCLVIVDNIEYLLDSRFMCTVITYHCPTKLKGEKV